MKFKSLRSRSFPLWAAALAAVALPTGSADAERIKDLAHVRGVRSNQLIGYGLVVGLQGTGDSQQVRYTLQTVASVLQRMNVRIDPQGLMLRNVATVMVTAELPAFSRVGNRIDIVVSSMGDAKSLQGGTLIITPLRGHDNQVYAMAQGTLSVGGFSVQARGGGGGAEEIRNHPNVARIPGGAIVEREVPFDISGRDQITLNLRDADFTTAARLAKVVNMNLGGVFANALDSGTVDVDVPAPYRGRMVEFVALVERLEVIPDSIAKVVVNERTGTIIMGQDVRISPVAVAHGNLTVSIRTQQRAVPAAPLTPGETVMEENAEVTVTEEKKRLVELPAATSLADVVEGLNQLGASPRDLITILQAIRQAGALRAEIEVM